MTAIEKKQILSIGNLIYSEFGIHIPQEKSDSLCLKIEKMIAREKYAGIDDIYMHLMSGDTECLEILIRYITTNHTFFFREPAHFKKMINCIKSQPQQQIMIWCAACSSGEEPYSIAISLLEEGFSNFKIIASDIDNDVLKIFHKGVFTEGRFIKTPDCIREKYFTPVGKMQYAIKKNLRKHIIIKKLNLMDDLLFEQQFDYIFCRNVFIYFNDASRRKTIDMIIKNLRTGGRFFIGHTETLFYDPPHLKKDGHSVYVKV